MERERKRQNQRPLAGMFRSIRRLCPATARDQGQGLTRAACHERSIGTQTRRPGRVRLRQIGMLVPGFAMALSYQRRRYPQTAPVAARRARMLDEKKSAALSRKTRARKYLQGWRFRHRIAAGLRRHSAGGRRRSAEIHDLVEFGSGALQSIPAPVAIQAALAHLRERQGI